MVQCPCDPSPARGSPSHRRKCQRRSSVTNIALFSFKYCSFKIFYNTSSATNIALFLVNFFIKICKSVFHKNTFFGNSYCTKWILGLGVHFSQICLLPFEVDPPALYLHYGNREKKIFDWGVLLT